ncbi:alpha/beta hydrolase family protein [Phenylobacterium terrae]|uniref:Alpha/beta hydrolase family protein n=1 Tax=Phenylobacterium terrae TaxID=2665495 RepID=A0ABW4N692_9CAUL
MRLLRRLAALAAASLTLAAPIPPAARPYTLDDHLAREALGRTGVSADGRWLVWERRGPYRTGARFDHDRFNDLFRTRLEVTDLTGPLGRRPLGPHAPGAGYALGPLSPDGARAAVFRLAGEDWRLGLADLPAAEVRWLDVAPEISDFGETLIWRSPGELLVIATADARPPFALRWVRPQAQLARRWAENARGGAPATAVGSGRYIGLRPRDPPKRLLRIDVRSGAVRELLRGDFTDLALSPDGRTLALFEASADIPLAAGEPVQGEAGIATRRLRLRLLDLKTGRATPAAPGWDLLAHLLAWSPDSRELLVYGRQGRTWRDGRLLRVVRLTGRAAPLPTTGLEVVARRRPEAVRAGWLAGQPVLWARGAEGRWDWRRWTGSGWRTLTAAAPAPATAAAVSGGRLLAVAGGRAWSFGPAGEARALAPEAAPFPFGPGGVPGRADLALPAGGGLLALRGAAETRELVRLTPGGAALVARLGRGEDPVAVGPGGALLRQVGGGGREAYSWTGPDGRRTPLLTLNARLADVEAPDLCTVAHTGPAGERLTSWLALPRGRPDPAPLVVWPYPGRVHRAPPAALDPRRLGELATPLLLVGHGYAVLLPSLPTPAAQDGPADGLAERILQAVDAATAARCAAGRVDAARLGLWGHSFGGYAALVVAGQTDRFAAVVAAAAPSELASLHGEFGPNRRLSPEEGLATPWTAGWVESLQGAMSAPPWDAPERYRRNSPVFAAGQVRTPLMIVHGELDGFPLGQAELMFSALYRQGKDAQLVTYWGEGHTFRSPGALDDLHRRAFAFLDSHLGLTGGRPPRPGSAPASGAPRPRRERREGGRAPRRRA